MEPDTITIDGTRFALVLDPDFTEWPEGAWALGKTRVMIDRYRQLLDDLRPRRIVEVGTYAGGSTALLALLTDADVIVSIDQASPAPAPLVEWIDDRGLGGVIRCAPGVNQGNREQLLGAVDRHAGPEPLDLVIDDASHRLGATRRTFEALFPRLRVGGVFVVEDWAWDVNPVAARLGLPDGPPLSRLVSELLPHVGSWSGVIDHMVVQPDMVQVVRGSAPLDASFSVR